MERRAIIVGLDRAVERIIEIAYDRPTEVELDGRDVVITRVGATWRIVGDLDAFGTHELALRAGEPFFVANQRFRLVVGEDLERAIADEVYLKTVLDPLTGVFSRAFLRAHERRLRPPCALLSCDLDHLAWLNDQRGFLEGDRVIAATARRIETQLRWPELVVRYGGEEFLAVLPGSSLDAARDRAEQIRLAMTAPIEIGTEPTITVTISIGIAMFDGSFADALRVADDNLQQAKQQGRDRVVG